MRRSAYAPRAAPAMRKNMTARSSRGCHSVAMRPPSLILALGALWAATACRPPPPAATREPPTSLVPAARWLELDGARLLVTTTRAAHGRADAGLPILIVLPWSRSTPAEALTEVGYVDIDAAARIVAIEGFERDGAGFSWWRRARPTPDPASPDDELVALLSDRAARLAKLVVAIRAHFGNASALVVSGISQGGDLSIALAMRSPAVITAALPIASRFPEPLWPRPPEPGARLPAVDAFQGTADPIAPFAQLQHAFTTLHDRGYPVVLHAYDGVAHEVAPAQRADIRACAALRLRGLRAPCPRSAGP
jgi:predicted esterase